jgi:integrase
MSTLLEAPCVSTGRARLATTSAAVAEAFPPRLVPPSWPATRLPRDKALGALSKPPFVLTSRGAQAQRIIGLKLLLDWLADQPGDGWQQRWLASGADTAGTSWRDVPRGWLHASGYPGPTRHEALVGAVSVAIAADLIRPTMGWLVSGAVARGHLLVRNLEASRDPEGSARLRARCADDERISAVDASMIRYRVAQILAAKGGALAEVTIGDLLELFSAEDAVRNSRGGQVTLYRVLRELGTFGDRAPLTLRALHTSRARTPEQLIDHYHVKNRPIRDLLVEYLRERQPVLDHTSLEALAYYLAKRFWCDIERHHPEIATLDLPRHVAEDWKQRLRTTTQHTRTASGETIRQTVERINYRECLTPVRGFYLDLAHWAVDDPSRWGPWVAPCPVGAEEINRKKQKRQRKARMDARTRERLPAVPVVARRLDTRRRAARVLLDAARGTPAGESFISADGVTLVRAVVDARVVAGRVWVHDPVTGARRDVAREEDHAFWAWAIVEVLRATGLRVEELIELSHYSLVQYKLPDTGELVPLLQVAPSKTDAERLLVVSPDLADVLATIIERIRRPSGAVPLIIGYDSREHVWSAPTPFLFQRLVAGENRRFPLSAAGHLLTKALADCGLRDPGSGAPLHFTPHDFRRIFITDAILNGLPPHIAQVIAGHRDISVTLGYKAVYPQEAIQAHLAFLARRRALRPGEEYRAPTDDEWQEFLGHFQRRKVSIGTCARAFGTPCIHEHACVRCPMLWPDPSQQPRIQEIRDNLRDRITEARREGWIGEVEGLQISLAGAEDKLAHLGRRQAPVSLGMPATHKTG